MQLKSGLLTLLKVVSKLTDRPTNLPTYLSIDASLPKHGNKVGLLNTGVQHHLLSWIGSCKGGRHIEEYSGGIGIVNFL